MIDYQTYCAIHDHHSQRGLNAAQIAEALQLDPRTVAAWLAEPRFRARQASSRASKLDPHKPTIRRWLEAHHRCSRLSRSKLGRDDACHREVIASERGGEMHR